MKIQHLDTKGNVTTKTVALDFSVLEGKNQDELIAKYSRVYLANQRQSNAHTKDRSEVSGGGKKPWRQKGTGRARHGSNRSPIWTGGGVTFGPKNEKNAKLRINKKEMKQALRAIIKKKEVEKQILSADIPKFSKTKDVVAYLNDSGLEGKVTLVAIDSELRKIASNIENVSVKHVSDLNGFDIASGGKIVFTQDSLDKFIDSRKLN
ncbi:MAG: 50S ribosomal protein L4 [Candidatus Dojkabacteria bacterium]